MNLRVLCVDPGLAAMGCVVLDVAGYGRWTLVRAETVRTNPTLGLSARLYAIGQAVREIKIADDVEAAVVECNPDQVMTRTRKGDPRSINKLMLATGAVVGALGFASPRLDLIPVSRWWPRDGRKMVAESDLVQQVRDRTQTAKGKHSEHALTACALGDWWTRNDGLRLFGASV